MPRCRIRTTRRPVLGDAGADEPAGHRAQPPAAGTTTGRRNGVPGNGIRRPLLFDKPVDDELRFKVGAQIMMLNNDQSDRWVNGSIGRVVGVSYDRYEPSLRSRSPTVRARTCTVHVGGDAASCRRRRAAA